MSRRWRPRLQLYVITAAFNVRCICRPKPTAEDFKAAFPLNPVDGKALAAPDADPTALQMVWIGHATMLVQMAGLTFLTDPVFSERCGLGSGCWVRSVPPRWNEQQHGLPI